MARPLFVAAPLALVAAVASLNAQWLPVPAAAGPLNRAQFTMTPLPSGELLLFGGDVANPAATEWSWNGIRWAPVTTPVPRRLGHAMALDEGAGRLVLFGGVNATNTLLDTWTFDGTTWVQQTPANSPPALLTMSMAWDPRDGGVVLVGRNAIGFETWRYDGANWSFVATLPLSFTQHAAVVTDTVRGEVALVVTGIPGVEVHRLQAGSWQLVASRTGAAGFCAVAFDRERGRAVALGFAGPVRFSFEYDGLGIEQIEGGAVGFTTAPLFAIAWHAARHETIWVDILSGAVARYLASPVPLAAAYGTPCVSPLFQLGLAAGDSPQPGASHRLQATGGATNAITLSAIGFSHVQYGAVPLPQPIPLGALGCLLRVEPLLVDVLGLGLPATRVVTLPNAASLLGARYDAQCLQFDASGIVDTSNGLEVQIGLPLPQNVLRETFTAATNRDARASGDVWGNGAVSPVSLGGDGRHGSFDPALGTPIAPGVYEWNTDNTTIPGAVTLTGAPLQVTDGRFQFTDFVVPAGVTVRFVGSAPAQLLVRGLVDVQGTLSVDAADMPFYVPTTGPLAGQRVSNFHARGIPTTQVVPGQAGGASGAGGGRGGDGGRECQGFGPVVVGGVVVTDGQPGQDVRVAAGHAYAGAVVNTGGRGSPLHPASGLQASIGAPFIIATLQYRDEFSPGGGGGGFLTPGTAPNVPTIPAPAVAQPNAGGLAAAGAAFPLLPYPANPPAGYSSLQHYLVGGAGGGGGGSHPFGIASVLTDSWMAGHGGSGGGGALALRAGGDVQIGGSVTARGGRGVTINGDNPATTTQDVDFGASSPGGGGSGGSIVVQSARNVTVGGTLDTSGGGGSRTSNVAVLSLAPFQLNVQAQAGAGATGFYRLEAGGVVTFAGTGIPAYTPAVQSGTLADVDARSGSRSTWLLPPTTALPVYLRYELVVDVAGQTLLYSDDAAVSPLAADGSGPVQLRFQGARLDPVTGGPLAGSLGPWRPQLAVGDGSLNRDRASLLRFDLVLDTSFGAVSVRELRIVWR